MYCSRCGKENDDNTKFCKSCGAKLPKPDVSESQLLSQENLTAQDEEGSSAVKGKKKTGCWCFFVCFWHAVLWERQEYWCF